MRCVVVGCCGCGVGCWWGGGGVLGVGGGGCVLLLCMNYANSGRVISRSGKVNHPIIVIPYFA